MSDKKSVPLEAYEAFVTTDPTRFDAFMRRWWDEHPQPVIADVTPIAEPAPTVVLEQVIEAPCEPSEPVKPTRKKKTVIE